MNLLTKALLEDLLDTQKTVAIYGGGFKPPTKGHFTVAKQILSDFPEIDELKIFVGKGIRDGIRITQDKSIQIWDIYKNYLSDKVNVEPSPQGEPTMDVIRYAKKHPEEKIYWFLGARDGDKGDIKDVEQRKNLLKKYPEVTNVEVKVITSTGGISGTKTRQALKAGDKEQFFQLIPDIEEKEQIWNIVQPAVKEEITPDQIKQADAFADKQLAPIDVDLTSKHVFDRLTGRDSDVTLAQLIGFFKRLGQNKKEFFDFFKKYKEIVATDERTNLNIPFLNMTNKAIAKTIMRKDNFLSSSPKLVFEVGEANLKPYKWEEVDREGYYVYTQFTTDSETQYDVDLTTTTYTDDDLNNLRALEIEFTAKPKDAEGSSAKIVVNKGEMYKVMSTIVDIVKKYIKKSKTQAIIYSPSKKSSEEDFGSQRDNLYRAFISKAIPGVRFEKNSNFITAILPDKTLNEADPEKGTGKKPKGSSRRLYTDEDPKDTVSIKFKTKEDIVDTLNKTSFKAKSHARQSQIINVVHQRVRAAYSKAKDPEVKSRLKRALDYIEKRKEMSKKKTQRLNKMKEASNPQAGTALPYGSGFAPVKENDLFGLNKLVETFVKEAFEEDWNLQDGMLSLTKYMMDNGMNIKPLPKIKVIKDDKENASNLLGKTAYYNPADKSITLFTMDRHPKDVLRSFSHEMVHHMQNLEGRLNNINTTNTSEDGHLDKIEREAIEIGGIMLRNWEDNIKNV